MKCDDRVLSQLLHEPDGKSIRDTGGETAREAVDEHTVAHIDSCERCQRRLLELAADDASWSETAIALGDASQTGSVVIAVDPELAADIPVQTDRVTLDFLDPPTHPEMLGRIGRYEVERLVGAGGMGVVLKAFDTELHRPVAVKVLAPHLAHSGGARQRFAREAKSAAAVVHENVVPIHNVDTTGKLPFLVMQYVAGDSLQARVDRDGPLSTNEVLRIGIQIAKGLSAAHEQGLIHRDVKPGNVLLETAVDRVLISDFGLARAVDDASLTRSGVIAGTPHYMSPEQARGESTDFRSDLFGLGGVLYFMCTGHGPFRADGAMAVLNRICQSAHRPVDEVNSQVPAELAELIDRLLSKEARRRPANSDEVVSELSRQLQAIQRGRTAYRPRIRRRLRSLHPNQRMMAGIVVTLAVMFASWVAFGPNLFGPGTHAGLPLNASPSLSEQLPREMDPGVDALATVSPSRPNSESESWSPVSAPPPHQESLAGLPESEGSGELLFHTQLKRDLTELKAELAAFELRWRGASHESQDPFND